jgi:L-galactose dehydrogenase
MQTHLLGRTGLHVSMVSLGGAAIGQQYGPISVADARETVHAAIDHGINLIDTSAFYGEGESERILGEVLSGGWRERVAISTKAGRHTRTHFDFSAQGMRSSLENSLRRLRTDHVEILLAHDIEFADNFEHVFTETADVLRRLKAEGKARFIGMSCLPLDLLKLAIERCRLDVVISYCQLNLQNNRLLTELLPIADQHGVGILNASPLAMGLLTNQGPPPWHPADDEIKATCAAAAKHCRERGADLATLGMQYCYAESRIPSTITGTAKRSELLENVKLLDRPPNPDLLAEVRAILQPIHNRSWASGNWSSAAVSK